MISARPMGIGGCGRGSLLATDEVEAREEEGEDSGEGAGDGGTRSASDPGLAGR